ncbi:MAG: MATE family efflux transporter [Eubacterium sp.]|nr:MATE family efflux transporter [Eubacterium sp.]
MEKDLTKGSVFKNLVVFSVPFLLSYLLQTLYGLADLFIIGQFGLVADTTAVSIGSQVMHMITVILVGLAMGATVLIGRAVGAKDYDLKNRAVGNTFTAFILVSIILMGILMLCCDGIVDIMSTPDEALLGTKTYLFICFAGIPFITVYNVIGSVFRGMGDSKSPMYFVIIACICNISLDYLFIGGLGFGPAGAALGTTISQAISVIVAFFAIRKKEMIRGIKRTHFVPDGAVIKNIFKVGIPVAAQDGFIQVSFIMITVFANMRGLSDSAAVGVVEKLIGILFLVPSTLLQSVSALCSQNIGAGREERARQTLYDALLIAVGCGVFFAILFQFIAPQAVGLFTNDAEVITLGTQYMKSYVWDCIFAGIHFMFSGYFCALNKSYLSFLHNVISAFLVRIPLAYYFSVNYESLYPMGFSAPIGSLVSVGICLLAFFVLYKKDKRNHAV